MAKILIVDDDPDLRKVLRDILCRLGEVAEAGDGEAALAALAREKPALMLLDLTMPGYDGLEVLARARAAAPHTIVVMLTGQTDLDVARTALERGARSYVTKPFDPEAIVAEVQRLLSGGGEPPPDDQPWRVVP